MANELEGIGQPDTTTYAMVKRRGVFANNTDETFNVYDTDDRNDYAVSMTELGDSSGMYQANFPSWITESGSYEYVVFQTAGSVSEEDTYIGGGTVDWTGSSAASSSTGAMTGSDTYDYILRTFKRTDKSQEVYDAITDTVRDIRLRYHFDEATADTTTTDTITVAGDFKIDVESNLGMLLGVVLQDDENARPLIQLTKVQFDEKYPDINVTDDDGYPKHYCVFAGAIYIGPRPDKTTYSYRLSYSTRGGTVTASTSAVPFTAVDREMVKHGALSRLFVMLEQPDLASVHEALFEKRFQINVNRERKNNGEGTFTVTPFGV